MIISKFNNHQKTYKLVLLLLNLCLLDGLITDFGLRNEWIIEANPLMYQLYDAHILYFYLAKLVPALLLFLLITGLRKNVIVQHLFLFTLYLYGGVILLHMNWIIKTFT